MARVGNLAHELEVEDVVVVDAEDVVQRRHDLLCRPLRQRQHAAQPGHLGRPNTAVGGPDGHVTVGDRAEFVTGAGGAGEGRAQPGVETRRRARRGIVRRPPPSRGLLALHGLHGEEVLQLGARVLRAELLAEGAVEQLGERPGNQAQRQDGDLDHLRRVVPHRQPVPRAEGLRQDLAEDEDEGGAGDNAHRARQPRYAVDQDGQHGVDERVAQQQRAQ
eukprot:scaffold2843_cov90-Isochrysis_galbana.AAC.3